MAPSIIVEFTATPVTPDEHNPAKGLYASNVLHHVSAAELKAEDMIKLPVILRGRAEPRDTIGDAIAWLDELVTLAGAEESETGELVRPVMLIQAEAKSKDKPTLHAEEVKKLLIEDFRVPEEHIALATGESREIDGVNLFDRDCKLRFIITQQALREGWDCSFAYVLCSVAEQKSSRAVEQILGRVLRLPRAARKQRQELNQAYAFATTTSFQNAAATLRDGLVNNGFERVEAQALVQVAKPLPGMGEDREAYEVDEPLPDELDAASFKRNVETATGGRVEVDLETGRLKARGALSDYDKMAMLLAMPPEAAPSVTALVHKSRGARLKNVAPETPVTRFAVPRLAVRGAGGPELFDRAHFLDTPWKLEDCDATLVLEFFSPPRQGREEAHVDVDNTGKVLVEFITDLHEQLTLALAERGWTKPALVNWIDRRLPRSHRQDITRISATLFIIKALEAIEASYGMNLDGLARAKFRLVEALVKTIAQHRDKRQEAAFQNALFSQNGLEFETSSDVELVFDESRYGYRQPYKGGTAFNKHLFRVVGDLEPAGEEYNCAVYLERLAAVKSWVRNTDRQPYSFWLQTSSDKFYPDFMALLDDGRILAVEYKGGPYVTNEDSKEKKLIGELWAERSNGRCLFLMVTDEQFSQIDRAIRGK